MTSIESPQNPRAKEWRKLQTHKGRRASGCFLAEGPHAVEEAFASGAPVRELIVRAGTVLPSGTEPCGVPIFTVSDAVMNAVCDSSTPQGLAAVCRLPSEMNEPLDAGRYLLIDGVQDPGNLGTMIRTADAAGLDGVVVGEGSVDPFAPKVVRATQGSIFHLPVMNRAIEDALDQLDAARVPVYGTGLGGGEAYGALTAPRHFALVVGNEGAGVRPEVIERCTSVLTIPMPGHAESLSVAVATGILLFHLIGGGDLR